MHASRIRVTSSSAAPPPAGSCTSNRPFGNALYFRGPGPSRAVGASCAATTGEAKPTVLPTGGFLRQERQKANVARPLATNLLNLRDEIGRASCRERW